jgi:hypothetical protein
VSNVMLYLVVQILPPCRYRLLDRLHLVTGKSSKTPLPSTKMHHGFANTNLWSRPSSNQEILVKTKTSPKGLGAVRPATTGGLTSCT